jgi:phage-related protein
MRTVGAGVYELREQDERAWYRIIYLKKVKNVVYVLHCFEKQTGQTEQRDINTARERLKRLQEQQRQDERIAKKRRPTTDPSDERKRP